MNVIDVFCFLFLASFVRFAHLLIFHTSSSSTYLPSTIFPSIVFLNPSSGSPFFPLLSISPLLRASRWQTDPWMADGQNKETQMWTIILALTHARSTRPSPGLWGQGLCWWSCGMPPGYDHTCVEVIRWRFAESRFDYRARRREWWLAVECRQCD